MTVNDGYFDFFQNWIHFYNKLQLNFPLIVIAEDDDVFLKLHQLNAQSVFTLVRSWRNSLRSAVVYGSKEFNELASGRPTYILTYLETGTNILYTDTDSVWLQDPFPYFQGPFDMWMQVDGPGNLCTGLMAIKSNNESIKLMRLWEAALKKRLDIDQTVFNQVFTNSTIHLKPLDRNLFPSGNLYFDQFTDTKRVVKIGLALELTYYICRHIYVFLPDRNGDVLEVLDTYWYTCSNTRADGTCLDFERSMPPDL
ncbi:uncharacterized protein LOC132756235 [Ruditapes philippinarum]|uniref:uncharacterized protein LOC132756235 n=1 Tax=Ruditapes philippinarum TaxID=129788 RepID=UPI00295B1CC3|nr:uncharacterized protein LOC132756235 [Ruditapes philippinarum]